MNITLFGIIWTIILIIAWRRGEKTLLFCLLFSTLFQAGAIITIRKFALDPLAYSGIIYLIYYFTRTLSRRQTVKLSIQIVWMLILFVVLFLSALVSSLVFIGLDYTETNTFLRHKVYDGNIGIELFSILFIYIMAMIAVYNSAYLTSDDIHKIINKMVLFVVVVSVWQYLTVLKVIPTFDLLSNIIYSNKATQEANIAFFSYSRNLKSVFDTRLYASFMEPSYCGGFLGVAFCYYISKKSIKRGDRVRVGLILLMTILTYSATAYLTVAMGGIIAIVYSTYNGRVKRIVARGVLMIAVSSVAVSYFGLWSVIEKRVLRKSETISAFVRSSWNHTCIDVFKRTYGVGIGYGNIRGSSLVYTILGSGGVIGILVFFMLVVSLLKMDSNIEGLSCSYEDYRYQRLMATVLVAMVAAIPDLTYTVFWLTVYISVSCSNRGVIEYESNNRTMMNRALML